MVILRNIFVFIGVFLSVFVAAESAHAGTANSRGTAVMVSPLTFFVVDELDFGRVIAGTSAGTVVVSPDGVRTATGGVTLASGAFQPVNFAGRGRINQFVSISLATSPNRITRVGGTQQMTIDTFVIGSSPTAILTTTPLQFRITGAGGIFNFPVGATLRVGANQTPGNYVGTFRITLNYL
jgi:hypothetical protein